MQPVVVDARGHMLGRLASVMAKQLLTGQYLVRPRANIFRYIDVLLIVLRAERRPDCSYALWRCLERWLYAQRDAILHAGGGAL